MAVRLLGWALLLGVWLAVPALAQTVRLMPVPPHIRPQWTKMPENPRVAYAPNVPADVFRGPGGYFLHLEGSWYQSRTLNGPWTLMPQTPDYLANINPGYFKTVRTRVAKKPAPESPAPAAPVSPGSPAAGATAAPLAQATSPTAAATPQSPKTPAAPAATAALPAPEPLPLYDPGPP